jgi:hypothetical protein
MRSYQLRRPSKYHIKLCKIKQQIMISRFIQQILHSFPVPVDANHNFRPVLLSRDLFLVLFFLGNLEDC